MFKAVEAGFWRNFPPHPIRDLFEGIRKEKISLESGKVAFEHLFIAYRVAYGTETTLKAGMPMGASVASHVCEKDVDKAASSLVASIILDDICHEEYSQRSTKIEETKSLSRFLERAVGFSGAKEVLKAASTQSPYSDTCIQALEDMKSREKMARKK